MSDCKCAVEVDICDDGTFYPIIYCPVHEAAPDLLAACKLALSAFELNAAIDWSIVEAAIVKAEGELFRMRDIQNAARADANSLTKGGQ